MPRRDVVVIISDGVPDSENHNISCPREGEPFIPEDVRWAYDELVNRKFSREEELRVIMLLAGGNGSCAPSIKERWITLFRPQDLVLFYAEVAKEPGLDLALFEQIDRDRCAYLTPLSRNLSDSSRTNLDHGKPFSVPYKAFSRLNGGRIRVHSGILRDEEGFVIGELAVSSSEESPKVDEIDSVWLPVEAPDGGRLRSSAFAVAVFLHSPLRETAPKLSPMAGYRLDLNATSDIGKVEVGEVEIAPSQSARQKERISSFSFLCFQKSQEPCLARSCRGER